MYLKTFYFKVYNGPDDSAANFLTTWKEDVCTTPSFKTIINGGAGELKFTLARKITNFGEGADVAFNNRIKLYIQDVDAPNGTQIFDGFISSYVSHFDGAQEYIEIICLSYTATLPEIIIRNGTASTSDTSITYSSSDPSTIFSDLITKYQAQGGVLTAGTIETTGQVITYTFQINNTQEGFERCRNSAPAGWYWRVNPDSTIDFKAESADTSPDHTLLIGQQIQSMDATKRMEDVKNVIYFVGGDTGGGVYLYKYYENTSSLAVYGRREYLMQDGRVTDAPTADIFANSYLDRYDNFEVRTTIKVMDNNGTDQNLGYDIESLKVGQTILIKNAAEYGFTLWDSAVFDTDSWDYNPEYALAIPMQIQTIQYDYDSVTLELSNRIPQVSRRIEDVNRNLMQTVSTNAPTNPTP